MTWTVDSSGTQTATGGGTEDIVVSGATTNATYVFKVDTSVLQASDVVELRVYTKILTGGSLVLAWKATQGPASAAPIFQAMISPPVASDFSIKCTIRQTAGTGRAFPWSLLRQ